MRSFLTVSLLAVFVLLVRPNHSFVVPVAAPGRWTRTATSATTLWSKDVDSIARELEEMDGTKKKTFELAELSENSYRKEHQLYQEEHESIRRLLWQAMKLVGRRIKNGFLWVVRFGRVPKKEQSKRKQ
ncbi:hypothetical protein IV203_027205 [Nitzschia inconspicua]|uniref:Secreted RxLR effector peptide protein n=1 Tax=Nitzschia inconspicua TaxID=303405 RepID=A0A9K3LWM4_9STRA|nr:hypothetical protein IV203_027205 [Nitzschia inconspicua]